MTDHDPNVRLHKLLRGEMAAVESYEAAVGDVRLHSAKDLLQEFLDHHRRAVAVLSRHTALAGDEPDRASGPWGTFARTIEKAASWIDDSTTLKALKEGEMHGVDEYRTALAGGTLPSELRPIVENELLPRQHEHVELLDALINGVETAGSEETLPDRVHQQRARG